MRIYVTGDTGFIGSAFCSLARARGHEVEGLSGGGRLENPPWESIRRFAPEVCVHTAWITEPGKYMTSEANWDYARWSIAFLDQMCAMGTKHLVSLGTCIEYAPKSTPLKEHSSPVAPVSLYARSKNDVRIALEQRCARHGCAFTWARIFYPYGPGEHPQRLASSIIASLRQDRPVWLNAAGSVKDYIYIDDVTTALLAIAQRRYAGTINVGTGIGVSVREIAHAIERILGKPGLVAETSPPAPDEYPFVVADASRLRKLGWTPQFDLAAGLDKLARSLP